MSETIQLYTNNIKVTPENKDCVQVTINKIEFDEIAPQFTAQEMIQAISDHYDFSTVFDIIMEMKGEDE